MPTCRLWRPAAVPEGHRFHPEPGSCVTCWRPCRGQQAAVDGGACAACAEALLFHQHPQVRAMLLDLPGVEADTVEVLLSDPAPQVSAAARAWTAAHTAARTPDAGPLWPDADDFSPDTSATSGAPDTTWNEDDEW